MKVLVLGSSGYIGSALCKRLENYVPYDLKEGQDIRSPSAIIPAIERADAIVHLAGTSTDSLVAHEPQFTWESNYLANDLIAKLLQNTGKRIVFASSGAVYGSSTEVKTEDCPLSPMTLYAKTKALSEELFLHPSINSIVFRFATAYGISAGTRFDTIINGMTKSAKQTGTIRVQGGSKRRSVLHVEDIVRGIILALELKNPPYRVFNLGTNDQNLTIREIAQKVQAVTGGKLIEEGDRPEDPRSYFINYDRVAALGFRAKYTIEEGVREIYGSI